MIRPWVWIVAVGTLACGGSSDGRIAKEEPSLAEPMDGVFGMAPPASGGILSVVTMNPVQPLAAPAGKSESGDEATGSADEPRAGALIDQFGLAFSPPRIIVRPGRISFANSESALAHNVHIRSIEPSATIFEGDALPGDVLAVEILAEGGYDVLCDMHPGMTAFVFVTDAPYAQFATTNGSFQLGRVPPGEYRLRLWTADRGFHDPVDVTVSAERTEVDLTASD